MSFSGSFYRVLRSSSSCSALSRWQSESDESIFSALRHFATFCCCCSPGVFLRTHRERDVREEEAEKEGEQQQQ